MATFLFYLLKSFICIGIFYLFYLIFLSKETYFSLNRYFLISTILLSFIIPAINITVDLPGQVNSSNMVLLDTVVVTPGGFQEVYFSNYNFFNIFLYIYFAGVTILLLYNVLKITQLIRFIKRYGITYNNGIRYVFNDAHYAPFSFFNFLFLDNNLKGVEAENIIAHEQIHVNQLHSFDVIVMEILTTFHWFNPFIWFYRYSLKETHEYLADEGVLKKGYLKVNYQELLLALSAGIHLNDLSNNFNNSIIKRRFIMMSKIKSGMTGKLKILLSVPCLVLLFWLFSCNKTGTDNSKAVKQQTDPSDLKKADDLVYTLVEEMPEFKGGDQSLFNFIMNNVHYPETAKTQGIQGKVFVSFVIDEKGKVTNSKVMKNVNPDLDAEALRVIASMPDWKPGKDKGKAVKVKFTIPINFKLN